MDIQVELNEPKIIQKVTNDRFGLLVATECKRVYDPYTPRDTGLLESNVTLRPFEIHYKEPYAHYMYEGILYVDPIYKVGAFYSPDYGFWSRKGVKKIPSGRKLQYQKNNPYSTDHWDKAAQRAGQIDKVCRILSNALNSGQF